MSIANPYVKFGLHRGGNGEIVLISAIFQTSNTLGGHSQMDKSYIKTAYDEISSIMYNGETPVITVEYGSNELDNLKKEFKKDGFHSTLINLDDKRLEEIRKELGILKDAIHMLDAKTVVFVEFRGGNEAKYKEALVVNEHLSGFCVIVKKIWNQKCIEIGKI